MAGFLDTVKQAIKSAYCSQVRNSPEWFGALRDIVIPEGVVDAANAFNRAICNSTDDASGSVPGPQFIGGQCPGSRYEFFYGIQWTSPTSGDVIYNSSSQYVTGPIQGWFLPTQPGTPDPTFSLFSRSASGDLYALTNQPYRSDGPPQLISASAVPRFGDPNDCGDPPTEFPDPGPIVVTPPDITFDDDDGNPVTVPITIIFAPVVIRANATVSIPITIDVGGINFTGNFDLFPNAEINLFPDAVINRPGTPDDPELTDPETGTDGNPNGEDQNNPRDPIIAVVVKSNKDGFTRASEVAQDDLPVLFAPRLGNVSFFVKTGSVSAWTPPQPLQFTNQHVPCPSPYGARDVKVWWDTGFTGSYTAIRGKPLGEMI